MLSFFKDIKILHNIFLSLHPEIRDFLLKTYSLIRFGYPLGYWSILQIEINSDCNRDCWFCWRKMDTSGMRKNEKGEHTKLYMNTDMVLSIIDQAHKFGYTGGIAFNYLNEAILDERVLFFANYAKQRGMNTRLTTNGDVIRKCTDQTFIDDIQQAFDKIHVGLYDYTSEQEREEARIFFMKKLHKVKFLDFWGGQRQVAIGMDTKKYCEKYETTIEEVIRTASKKPCHGPDHQMIVKYNGTIPLCCGCGDGFVVDNINQHKLWEYWYSDKHMNYVKGLSKPGGRLQFKECKDCPENGDYPEHIWQQLKKEMKEKKKYYLASPRFISKTGAVVD